MRAHSRSSAAAAFAVLVPLLNGCSRSSAAPRHPDEAQTVAVSRVLRGDLTQALTLAAEFRPYQEIDVHSKVAGYVKSIGVDVGDRVKTGQLLAVLEIPELQDEIRQDEAAVKRSEEEVNRAQADLARTEAAHETAHLGATRLASVMKSRPNLVAQQDIDEAQGRDRVAEAQVATAKASLAAAREQLEVARANRSKSQTLFAYARITAPFSGVITHRYADTGAMIQAGTSSQSQSMPLVKLSDNSVLRLIIQVPESSVPRIHVGEPVEVKVQALGRTFPGTVARFDNKLNPETRTMETEVDVQNPKLELVPGMYADASIALDEARGAVIAPVQAIERKDDQPSVMVVDGAGRVETRPVHVGLETADRVEITDGLRDGELVVVGNRAQLRAGATVTPKIVQLSNGEGTR